MNDQQLLVIGTKKRNGEIKDSWNELARGTHFKTGEDFRMWVKNQPRAHPQPEVVDNFKETHDIHSDGTQSSNKLLRLTIEQKKDANYLLNAHDFDAEAWELVTAKHNIWNAYSKKDGIMELYSSKITVRPRKEAFSFERLISAAKEAQPIKFKTIQVHISNHRLIEIPIFDPHFGVSTIDDYKQSQAKIMDNLTSRRWGESLLIIGQDTLHNDSFRGQTANGTQIETVDMAKAWEDALSFYAPLIEASLTHSNRAKIMYSKGNHDESLSWAFVQMLKARYPQAVFDDAMQERKCHVFGDNFIGVTHGDKARKNLHNIFPIEFPLEWSRAKNREIHTGHYHIEDGKDVFGMMVRTLSTRNKTDKWHKDNGFVGGHKRFMLFEYSEAELESIHYV